MANGRPIMPRARPAEPGHDPAASGDHEDAVVPAPSAPRTPAAVNRQKVVPMGAAPGPGNTSEDSPSPSSAAGRSAAKKPTPDKPAARKQPAGPSTARKQPGTPAAPGSGKSPAKSSPASRGRAPATPSAAKSTPAGKRPGPRPSGPREKRLRERAELSGAIRSGNGHREPEATQAPTEAGAPVPARAFSGRLLTLAVILAVVTVLLLPSVGTYMDQRAEVAEVQASIAEKQQEQAELTSQIARWDDPAYVKAQARNRINLVMPGEKKYMVVGATGDDSAAGPQSVGDVRTDLPWVDSLWDTVVRSATD
ncbi:MAG: septum formation initiator family protein [Micrococcaceae bacterium]|nr:septum formation initiator family protein [Micrococcaceae bacterium]